MHLFFFFFLPFLINSPKKKDMEKIIHVKRYLYEI